MPRWFLFLLLSALLPAQTLVLTRSKVLPAAVVKVDLAADQNGNTTVDLTAQHMAQATSLPQPAGGYVVWIEPPGQAAQRMALLKVNSSLNGEVKFTTPDKNFVIVITAESDPSQQQPSGQVIVRSAVARSAP